MTASILTAGFAAFSDDVSYSPTERSVLLLRNGRIVEGHVSQSAGGYVVSYSTGRMMVPFSQVKFQADSVESAFRRLRRSLPPGSSSARLSLATWCLTNSLYNHARNEVDIVLKAEPENKSAQRMLHRIDELLDPKRKTESDKQTLNERLMAPEVTALAGLPSDIAARYVSRVQPILMNGCALAGCHGPRAKNGLRLERVRLSAGNRRTVSERNLAAVLRFTTPNKSGDSPLLERSRGKHGVRGRVIFRGRSGARQLAVLQNWVRDVGRESGQSATLSSRQNARTATRQPQRVRNGYGATPALRAARIRLEERRIVNGLTSEGKKRERKPVESGDPFDPAEFNRNNSDISNPSNRPTRRRESFP